MEEAVNLATAVPFIENILKQKEKKIGQEREAAVPSFAGLLQRITSSRQNKATSGNENVSDKVLSEMKMYKSLPTISTDTDPLAWWKMHADMCSKCSQKVSLCPCYECVFGEDV